MRALALAALGLAAFATAAQSEEGGSGHYFPGSMASFMDGVSPVPALMLRYNFAYYDGAVDPSVTLPIAGEVTAGAHATSFANGITIFFAPSWGRLDERWNYAMSATVPLVSLDVEANVMASGGEPSIRRQSEVTGLGDMILMPLMVNYHASADCNLSGRVAIIAPTGSYEVGRLANTGKNFWTVEPTLGLVYLGQKNGREFSLFTGMDFNSENEDTDYKSGTQFHVESTIAQHFAAAGGLLGAGATGYWYEQITGDSGSGATFGGFEAKTIGIGPVVSYVRNVGGHDLLTELKWLTETETKRRLDGDTIFLKVMYKVY